MQEGKKEKTFYIQWHFIERCNLRCSHCYQKGHDSRDIDDDKIFRIAGILDTVMEKWQRQGRLSLTGGEPFMRKDLLAKLLDFFDRSPHFYWLGILTNGTLIDNDILEKIKPYKKLKEIQVSLDGASELVHDEVRGKGNFALAVRGIETLKAHDFTVSVMFTLHKQNMGDVTGVIELADGLGVDYLTIERIVLDGSAGSGSFTMQPDEVKKVYEIIYKKKKEIEKKSRLKIRVSRPLWCLIDEAAGGFCPAGLTSLAILADGTVLPCRRLELPLGNILEEGLYKIWYTSEILWKLRNKNLLTGKCKGCRYLGKCGGCRAIAYYTNSDYMAEDPQCWLLDDRQKLPGQNPGKGS